MSYTPTTDFLALLRNTGGGERVASVPGLDWVVVALARAGLITLVVSQTAPAANQVTTAWFKPNVPSWTAEGALFLWNGTAYVPATPILWSTLLAPATSGATPIVQNVTTIAANVNLNTTIVQVQNVGALVTLTMPPASTKIGNVLISDWANHAGTNNIVIDLSGSDVFPGGGQTWTIGADAGSVFLRPVPGGYVL